MKAAERALDMPVAGQAPPLTAAVGMHGWLRKGGERPPIRHWQLHPLLRAPVPLTGPRALGADVPFEPEVWIPVFLEALADEAADYLQLLLNLERGWLAARSAVAGRRRTSRAAAAIDIMAATPLAPATTLAGGLGMAVKNTTALLASLATAEIAVEVTHRSKRRLFGLAGLAPLREQVRPPRQPEPGVGDVRRSFGRKRCCHPRRCRTGSRQFWSGALSTTAISRRGWRTPIRRSARRGRCWPDAAGAGQTRQVLDRLAQPQPEPA